MAGGGQWWYLQPLLSLLLALHGQHQWLSPRQGETQLVLLAPPILGDIDDIAGAQGHFHVWLPVLGAFVALGEAKTTAQGSASPAAMPRQGPCRLLSQRHRRRWFHLCNPVTQGLRDALSLCSTSQGDPNSEEPFFCLQEKQQLPLHTLQGSHGLRAGLVGYFYLLWG